jgi:two-component system, LytTR family, response regulator
MTAVSELIRVMIVEDEEPSRAMIRRLLEGDPELEVAGETWGRQAVADIEKAEPDLILLDVRMPRLDGFEVLRRLDMDPLPVVVFVTAHEEHALEAFEVRAIDYVLKPFSDTRFREAIARAKERVGGGRERDVEESIAALARRDPGRDAWTPGAAGPEDRIVLQDGGATVVLPPSGIAWIEASGPYVVIHAEGRELLVRASLGSMEERLAPRGFFRAHRSAVVNLDFIREIRPLSHGDAVVHLKDGSRVKLSRSRRARLDAMLRGA